MKSVLVVGNIHGKFKQFFEKVKKLNEKNKFDFILCVGQSFDETKNIGEFLKNSKDLLIIPTYLIDFSDISNSLCELHPQGLQLAENLYFLGRSDIIKIQGIHIAFLNGIQCHHSLMHSPLQENQITFSGQYYQQKDIEHILNKLKSLRESGEIGEERGIDIMIGNEWPSKIIDDIEKKALGVIDKTEMFSTYLDTMIDQLSPRYHFVAGTNIYYQRVPYVNTCKYITRYLSLASFMDTTQKYMYAFKLESITEMSEQSLFNLEGQQAQQNPYRINTTTNRKRIEIQEGYVQQIKEPEQIQTNSKIKFQGVDKYETYDSIYCFMERMGEIEYLDLQMDTRQKRSNQGWGWVKFKQIENTNKALESAYSLNRKQIVFSVGEEQSVYDNCWFCWQGQACDKGIVVKEFREWYVCLDKGPIEMGHLQIVPKKHICTRGAIKQQIVDELVMIKKQIERAFGSNQMGECDVVFYEKYLPNRVEINHYVIHAVPIMKRITGHVLEKLKKFNQENCLEFIQISGQLEGQLRQGQSADDDYYMGIQIADTGYLMRIDGEQYYRQKGLVNHELLRQLLNHLLDKEQKAWRDIQISQSSIDSVLKLLKPLFK